MSITDHARTVATTAPGGYLVAWVAGIPVEKWAAAAALVWTLGLMVQNWLWKPWIKPYLEKRRGQRASA